MGYSANVMEWSDSRQAWRLFVAANWFKRRGHKTLYISATNSMAFPTGGWVAVKGRDPVPTVNPLYD